MREFAAPLTTRLPVTATVDAHRHELLIAAFVWNALNRGVREDAIVRELSATLPGRDVATIVDELAALKRDRFAADRRLVLDLETYESDRGVEIVALSQR